MSLKKIVIPSESPGGLNAAPGEHFGQCAVFTVVTVEEGVIYSTTCHKNIHALCRNCFIPIKYLLDLGMDTLLVNRLGAMPLRILNEIGVSVYHFSNQKIVNDVVKDFIMGKLKQFTQNDVCHGECGQ